MEIYVPLVQPELPREVLATSRMTDNGVLATSSAFILVIQEDTPSNTHTHTPRFPTARNSPNSPSPITLFFCFYPRVIQLGLRGDVLAAFRGPAFGGEGGIRDVTAFAKATWDMHNDHHVAAGGRRSAATLSPMMLPTEEPYPVEDALVAQRLGVD